MTLEQLLADLRTSRLDDGVAPYLWSDEELVGYLNDAVRQVCIRQRCLIESVMPAICRIPFVAGQRLLPLHPAVLAVRWALIEGDDGWKLGGTTSKRLAKRDEAWMASAAQARPCWWVPDFQDKHLALHPLPDSAGTLVISAWRTPVEDELLDLADPSMEPVIPEQFHIDLLDWAEYRAFGKKDAETLDVGRSDKAAASFVAKIGRLPSAVEIRLWGVQRIVGTRPEFV